MDYQTKSWMHDLAYNLKIEGFKDRPLCQIALPGTHDSGTSGIDSESADLTPDAESPLIKSAFFAGTGSKQVVCSWAISQTQSITDQLNSGSRYLDLRVAGMILVPAAATATLAKDVDKLFAVASRGLSQFVVNAGDSVAAVTATDMKGLDEPCICHSVSSVEVKNVIEQVAAFLQENNREVVILDFQHFYSMSKAQHNKIVGYLRNKLGNMMVNPQRNPKVTLRDLEGEFNNKGRCIVIYNKEGESAGIIDENKDILWARDISIKSPWAETDEQSKLVSKLTKDTFSNFPSGNCFIVAQGILNPEGIKYGDPVWNRVKSAVTPNSSNPTDRAKSIAFALIGFSGPAGDLVSRFQYRGKKPNVVMIDDFTEAKARKIIANNIYPDTLALTLGETSDTGPALLKSNNRLYMVWRATNQNYIVYITSSDGVIWSEASRVTTELQTTTEPPTACEFKGNVYVAWKATDDKGSICVAPINGDGKKSWVVNCKENGVMTTKSRPALVTYRDRLYVFWRATNENHLVYAYSDNGESWYGSYMAGPNFNTSESGPSVTVYKDQLVMAWRGTGQDLLVYATYDANSGRWSESSRVCADLQTTQCEPAVLGASDGYLYVAWRATSANQTLMYARYNGTWSSPSPVKHLDQSNESTDAAISLADDAKQVLVAWKGKGNRNLNVGTLETR